jgi:hypothetical protein
MSNAPVQSVATLNSMSLIIYPEDLLGLSQTFFIYMTINTRNIIVLLTYPNLIALR